MTKLKALIDGSPENREMRKRACVKGLIELSKGDDYIFLMDKFNTVVIDGVRYSIKIVRDE